MSLTWVSEGDSLEAHGWKVQASDLSLHFELHSPLSWMAGGGLRRVKGLSQMQVWVECPRRPAVLELGEHLRHEVTLLCYMEHSVHDSALRLIYWSRSTQRYVLAYACIFEIILWLGKRLWEFCACLVCCFSISWNPRVCFGPVLQRVTSSRSSSEDS